MQRVQSGRLTLLELGTWSNVLGHVQPSTAKSSALEMLLLRAKQTGYEIVECVDSRTVARELPYVCGVRRRWKKISIGGSEVRFVSCLQYCVERV